MFFHVAGGGPFGEFRRIIFVGVGHDGFEDMQGNGGFVRGVFQSAGGAGFRAHGGAFGGDGGLKVGDVRIELGDECGGQAGADEQRGERDGIGGKGAGGIEQGLIAVVVRHEKFSGDGGVAEQQEGMGGGGDANHVVMEMKASGDFGEDGAVGLFATGNLRGAEAGGQRHGGVNEGELLSAETVGRKIGGVFGAEGVHGFESANEAGDFLFHNDTLFIFVFPFPEQVEDLLAIIRLSVASAIIIWVKT